MTSFSNRTSMYILTLLSSPENWQISSSTAFTYQLFKPLWLHGPDWPHSWPIVILKGLYSYNIFCNNTTYEAEKGPFLCNFGQRVQFWRALCAQINVRGGKQHLKSYFATARIVPKTHKEVNMTVWCSIALEKSLRRNRLNTTSQTYSKCLPLIWPRRTGTHKANKQP